jgi:MFS family permease
MSAIEAGLAFLPMTFTIAAATTVAGRLSSRIGPGRVLAGGMSALALGLLSFSFLDADGSYVADVLGPGVLTAAGIGFSFVPVTIAAVAGIERDRAGLASGLVNTSRQFGGSVGLAVLATIAASTARHAAGAGGVDPAALTEGFHTAFVVGAAFALAGALTAALALGRAPRVAVPEAGVT